MILSVLGILNKLAILPKNEAFGSSVGASNPMIEIITD